MFWLSKLLSGFKSKKPNLVALDPLEEYRQRIQPLGYMRCRILSCTLGGSPRSSYYFNPTPDSDLVTEFFNYLQNLWKNYQTGKIKEADQSEKYIGSCIVAAGLLTFGDLKMADYILSNLPSRRIELDHSCGYCLVIAVRVTAYLLPIPKEMPNSSLWIENSVEADQIRTWFHTYRDRFIWDVEAGKFTF
jgi:hypothetical protein